MHATPNIKSRQLAPRARCHVEGLCPDDDAHINVMVMMAILFVEVAFSSFRCHRSLRSGGSPPHPRESCRSPPWRWGGGWRRSVDDGDGDGEDDGDDGDGDDGDDGDYGDYGDDGDNGVDLFIAILL